MDPRVRNEHGHPSSILAKVPPDLRRQIDIAIVERAPPTYQAVWMTFNLADHGVSYMAFYRYARRLRDRANLAELAALGPHDEDDVTNLLPKLIGRELVEELLNNDVPDSREIATPINAHRQALKNVLQIR
jgi:hypothetical protein